MDNNGNGWKIRELDALISASDTTNGNALGFDADEFRLFQLLNLHNSPLVKFFSKLLASQTIDSLKKPCSIPK